MSNNQYVVVSVRNSLNMSTPLVTLGLGTENGREEALKFARSIVKREDSYKVSEVMIFKYVQGCEYYASDYKDPKKNPLVWRAFKKDGLNNWREEFLGDFKDSPDMFEITSEEKVAPPGKFRVVLSLVERHGTTLYRCGDDFDSESEAVALVNRMDHEHELIVYNDKGDVAYHVQALSKSEG